MPHLQQYILQGKVVTMLNEGSIIENGYVIIEENTIQGVYENREEIPYRFSDFLIIETGACIFPGLIDLHNHLAYNVLPMWEVPRAYTNRSQWQRHREYRSGISQPMRRALARYSPSSKAIVRYVEAKAIIGGVTTGQGMRTRVNGGERLFIGAMRNVEEPKNNGLKPANTRVPNLIVTGSSGEENIRNFRRTLNDQRSSAYFYHLSEGIDASSRTHFLNLKEHNLINHKLVGIHSLALNHYDMTHLADKKAKVVWSPLSNLLLYGQTLDLRTLKDNNITFSLGCDWSPTGSKNLLQELKVADAINSLQGDVFSRYELVSSVTKMAAEVVSWQQLTGTVEEGKLADLLIVETDADDPYEGLIRAIEKDIQLVLIDGVPRFGEPNLMSTLLNDSEVEEESIQVYGQSKSIFLYSEDSEINDLGFNDAAVTLKEIMSDLQAFIDRMENERVSIMQEKGFFEEEFILDLDDEMHSHEADEEHLHFDSKEEFEAFAAAEMVNSIELDAFYVDESSLTKIANQLNLSEDLKAQITAFYS